MAHVERVEHVAEHTVVLLGDRGVRHAVDVMGHCLLVSGGDGEKNGM